MQNRGERGGDSDGEQPVSCGAAQGQPVGKRMRLHSWPNSDGIGADGGIELSPEVQAAAAAAAAGGGNALGIAAAAY